MLIYHNKIWKILKEMGIPDHLTCLLRSLYAGQEAKVRTRHGTTDWFKIGKGVHQGSILSPSLFNFSAEWKWKSLNRVRLFVIPWTLAHQAPLLWDSPGKNAGVGCYSLFQGIFPSHVLNPDLPHCLRFNHLSHQWSWVHHVRSAYHGKRWAGWLTSWNQDCW